MLNTSNARRVVVTTLLAFSFLLSLSPAQAQTTGVPWTGVLSNEAQSYFNPFAPYNELAPRAISGDGQFVVFRSEDALDPSDTNGTADVFLSDRHNGIRVRISLSGNGDLSNGWSGYPTIS